MAEMSAHYPKFASQVYTLFLKLTSFEKLDIEILFPKDVVANEEYKGELELTKKFVQDVLNTVRTKGQPLFVGIGKFDSDVQKPWNDYNRTLKDVKSNLDDISKAIKSDTIYVSRKVGTVRTLLPSVISDCTKMLNLYKMHSDAGTFLKQLASFRSQFEINMKPIVKEYEDILKIIENDEDYKEFMTKLKPILASVDARWGEFIDSLLKTSVSGGALVLYSAVTVIFTKKTLSAPNPSYPFPLYSGLATTLQNLVNTSLEAKNKYVEYDKVHKELQDLYNTYVYTTDQLMRFLLIGSWFDQGTDLITLADKVKEKYKSFETFMTQTLNRAIKTLNDINDILKGADDTIVALKGSDISKLKNNIAQLESMINFERIDRFFKIKDQFSYGRIKLERIQYKPIIRL